MNKKIRVILNIFYWLFIFVMGFLIVAYAPKAISYNLLFEKTNSAIKKNNQVQAVHLNELYYDSEVVYQSDDYQLTLFQAVSKETQEKNVVLTKKYVGIIKDVEKSRFNVKGSNAAKILLNDTYQIDILSTDTDKDGENDSVSTLINFDFIYFYIPYLCQENISKISLLDFEGKTYFEYAVDLHFNESFFTDIDPVINDFNQNGEISTEVRDAFLAKKDSYKETSFKNIYIKAQQKTFGYMVLFVFVALLFYDVGLGLHLTWIPVKWLYKKVTRKKKEKKAQEEKAFKYEGNTQIIVKARVPEKFVKQIKIKYQNDETIFEIVLRKSLDYEARITVKAGLYHQVLEDYGFLISGLPENLNLDRFIFTLNLTVKEGSLSDGTNSKQSSAGSN